ncbi:hypothetical protein AAY81_00235 [Denitrobacterium detoxificans]|nr:hypothetical protein AAY81_00235 [Denitrobacterium detoxificans]
MRSTAASSSSAAPPAAARRCCSTPLSTRSSAKHRGSVARKTPWPALLPTPPRNPTCSCASRTAGTRTPCAARRPTEAQRSAEPDSPSALQRPSLPAKTMAAC